MKYCLLSHIEHCGNELLDNLRHGFNSVDGFIESNDNPDFAFYIGNGGNLEDPSSFPAKNKILLLTENIPVDMFTPNNKFKLFLLERYVHVWDYIFLMDYGVDKYLIDNYSDRLKAKLINCNYVSILESNISNKTGGNGDCCFIGQVDGRRNDKIIALRNKGITVDHIKDVKLNDWTKRTANYSYMLNIHYDDSVHNELLRIYFGMATDCLVITETQVHPEEYGIKHDYNVCVVDDIEYLTKDFLKSINKDAVVHNAHETVKQSLTPIKAVEKILSYLL